MKIKIHQSLALFYVCTAMLLGINEASAFTSMGNTIKTQCGNLGYPLLNEYARDTCDAACHNNNQGQSAYSSGNWEYFCPEPIVQGPTCTDSDNDKFFAEGLDCGTLADFNDNSDRAFPGATEDCTDGIDNNGNGWTDSQDPVCQPVCTDLDGDNYNIEGGNICGPVDCDDGDAAINPGAQENCSDNIDNNCNGLLDSIDMNAVNCPIACTDNDGDGYSIEGGDCGVMDCDDNNIAVNPAELEICDDGIDNNCNNRSDDQDNVCPAPDTGGDTPTPDPAPDTGDDTPTPDPAPDTGGDNTDSSDQDSQPWWRNRSTNRSWWRNRSTDRDDNDDDDEDSDDASSGSSDDDDDEVSSSRSRRSWSSRRSSRDNDDD